MKKLITFIIVASLAITIQAQDITNTLGTDGFFYIESESGTELVFIGSFTTGNGLTEFSFSNKLDYSTDFSINNYGNNNLNLNLMKARGNTDTPEDVVTGNVLGTINFEGYHEGVYHTSATISARVDGDPGSYVPGELIF